MSTEKKPKMIQVEFWNSEYKGAPSKLVRVEEWEDCEASFVKFYDLNIQLKYCNGTHYSFVSNEVRERYNEFVKEHNTISNYYKGGVVD